MQSKDLNQDADNFHLSLQIRFLLFCTPEAGLHGLHQQPPLSPGSSWFCYCRAPKIREKKGEVALGWLCHWVAAFTEPSPPFPPLVSLSLGLLFLATTLSLVVAQDPLFCRKPLYNKSFFIFFRTRLWLLHQVCLSWKALPLTSMLCFSPFPASVPVFSSSVGSVILKTLRSRIRTGLWDLGLQESAAESEVSPQWL